MLKKITSYYFVSALLAGIAIWLNFFNGIKSVSFIPSLVWADIVIVLLLLCLFLWKVVKEKNHFILSALKSSRDALFIVNRQGQIVEFSHSAEKLFGFNQERVLFRPWEDVVLPMEERQNYAAEFQNLVQTGTSNLLQNIHVLQGARHDGFTFPAEMIVHSVGSASHPLYIFSFRDITEVVERDMKIDDLLSVDSLAGVANRQKILHQFDYENGRFTRYENIFSALLLDIDNFKQINEQYGQKKADKVLRAFAQTCKKHLRNLDRIGRISGADFVIVLPETRIAEAKRVAEKIRKAVEGKVFDVDGEEISITVSVGITSSRPENNTRKDMLERLDKALQYAKTNGKNMAVVEV